MTFGEAKAHMRVGKMARRECWDTWVFIDKNYKAWDGTKPHPTRFKLPKGLAKEHGDFYDPTDTERAAKDWVVQ